MFDQREHLNKLHLSGVVMPETFFNIPTSIHRRLIEALEVAKDSTNELLTVHLQTLGDTTKKNLVVANMYRDVLEEIDYLIRAISPDKFP